MAWKYFSPEEMKCRCCGECKMDNHFMDLLDSLRKAVGEPLVINSGYRCAKHDAEEGGGGNHTTGKAADLKCENSSPRFKIIKQAILLGFKRIGIGNTFIHIDICGDHPQEVCWLY